MGIFHQSGFHHLHPVHNSQTNSCLIYVSWYIVEIELSHGFPMLNIISPQSTNGHQAGHRSDAVTVSQHSWAASKAQDKAWSMCFTWSDGVSVTGDLLGRWFKRFKTDWEICLVILTVIFCHKGILKIDGRFNQVLKNQHKWNMCVGFEQQTWEM